MSFTMDPVQDWTFGPLAQANFGIGWGLYWTFVALDVWEWLSATLVVLLETAWHITMGFVPGSATPGWTIPYILGSDGFNYPRFIWAIGGMIMALIIDLIHWPHTRPLGGYDKNPCGKIELEGEDFEDCIKMLKEEGIWYYDEETEIDIAMEHGIVKESDVMGF